MAPSLLSRPRGRRRPHRRYLRDVEPQLLALPRVHRFAQVPLIAEASGPAEELLVFIDGARGGDASVTRASLEDQTKPPAAVVEGRLDEALAGSRADRIAIVAAGDRLAGVALERLGQAARMAPAADVVTADADALEQSGRRCAPRLRPGPSPDLLLECDHTAGVVVVRRERAMGVAGARAGIYELVLALSGADGARHAHVPLILCHRAGHDLDDAAGGPRTRRERAIVERVLSERGGRARLDGGWESPRRVRHPLAGEPSVEVVVPFRDAPELLRRCVRSLLSVTAWENLRVLAIDNGSEQIETAELLRELARDQRVRVRRDERDFNFSALCNAGARASEADVLVFLNNDTEVLEPGWLEALLEHALREQVGAVAPLLIDGDGAVQHAGAAIGLHGYAGHPFAGLAPGARTPFGSATDGTRNWMAVTAACMVVERAKFEAAGGFDEDFQIGGGDVDLCLRLTAAGRRSLCVPHVRVRHDESASRGARVGPGDHAASERSYGDFRTIGDPFYNPSLTLRGTDCSLRRPEETIAQ